MERRRRGKEKSSGKIIEKVKETKKNASTLKTF
jgi:hypothetical protein